jgi:hypothetical protein
MEQNEDLSLNRRGVASTLMTASMLSSLEVPACNSESRGQARVHVNHDGTVDGDVTIYNRGAESIRFGHIHHLNPGAATGPVIWWLSSPIGVDLNITDNKFNFSQLGAFVTNAHFSSEAAAHAELLARPQDFYVNFHSDLCPGGFARGFLSVWESQKGEGGGGDQ